MHATELQRTNLTTDHSLGKKQCDAAKSHGAQWIAITHCAAVTDRLEAISRLVYLKRAISNYFENQFIISYKDMLPSQFYKTSKLLIIIEDNNFLTFYRSDYEYFNQ